MRFPLFLLGLLLSALAAFATPRASQEVPAADKVREELLDADRRFAAAARERGLDGWMSFLAADAVRLPKLTGAPVRGTEAIRKLDAAIFADPARRLAWEPAEAESFEGGRLGVTTGHYRVLRKGDGGKEEVVARGSYLTWWRKDDGKWRVILDTGTPDPPAKADKP
jgi:ketosteroid isomerase-like protein